MKELNKFQDARDKRYNDISRKQPAIISLVFPLICCLYFFHKKNEGIETVEYVIEIILSFGAIVPALLFFYTFVMREISILCIEKPMNYLSGKPVVNMMLSNNSTFEEHLKKQIKQYVKERMKIDLNNSELLDNGTEGEKYKRIINHVAGQIREIERVRDNAILFEFNCTYGFFRNLTGGFLFNIFMCFILLWINKYFELDLSENLLMVSLIFLVILFFICLLFTRRSSTRYAERLYNVFMSKCINKLEE